jgi:hypothetical protein
MRYIAIREWAKHQHYSDRSPPWIKLHRDILTSATWVASDDATRVLAVALMVLASQCNNRIMADPDYIKRVAYLNKSPDLSKLVAVGFIDFVDENGVASGDADHASNDPTFAIQRREEKRRSETEKNDHAFNEFWSAYPNKVGKGKAREAYAKALSKAPAEQINLAVKSYPWPSDSQFIPHPTTWLNQERWSDQPAKRSAPEVPAVKGAYVAPPDPEGSWPARATNYAAMIKKGMRAGMQSDQTILRLVDQGYVSRAEAERAGYWLWSGPDDGKGAAANQLIAELGQSMKVAHG